MVGCCHNLASGRLQVHLGLGRHLHLLGRFQSVDTHVHWKFESLRVFLWRDFAPS